MLNQKCKKAIEDSVINLQNYNFNQFFTENVDALRSYESTEVDRRTWLHVPSWTHWSTSSDTHQVVEKSKEKSTKMFKAPLTQLFFVQ